MNSDRARLIQLLEESGFQIFGNSDYFKEVKELYHRIRFEYFIHTDSVSYFSVKIPDERRMDIRFELKNAESMIKTQKELDRFINSMVLSYCLDVLVAKNYYWNRGFYEYVNIKEYEKFPEKIELEEKGYYLSKSIEPIYCKFQLLKKVDDVYIILKNLQLEDVRYLYKKEYDKISNAFRPARSVKVILKNK